MGEATATLEPVSAPTNLRKQKGVAKLPSPAVLQSLSPAHLRRLKRLMLEPTECVFDAFFDQPDAEALLRRSPFEWRRTPDANDSGVYGLDSYRTVLELPRERFLFLRLNFCRWQVQQILTAADGRRLDIETVEALLRWEDAVIETRGEIVRENVPLGLAMAKRTRITGVDLTDLISEGNLALLRAVNKFDSSRGYKFSTYACRAILKSFSRIATRMARHRGRFPTEFDPTLEKSDLANRVREATEGRCVNELKSILADNTAQLSEVERQVILARFALDAEGQAEAEPRAATLEQVGQMIGVTKERVRQIQNKALGKLRAALEQNVLA